MTELAALLDKWGVVGFCAAILFFCARLIRYTLEHAHAQQTQLTNLLQNDLAQNTRVLEHLVETTRRLLEECHKFLPSDER